MPSSRAKKASMIEKYKKPIKEMQSAVNLKTKGLSPEVNNKKFVKTLTKYHKM